MLDKITMYFLEGMAYGLVLTFIFIFFMFALKLITKAKYTKDDYKGFGLISLAMFVGMTMFTTGLASVSLIFDKLVGY